MLSHVEVCSFMLMYAESCRERYNPVLAAIKSEGELEGKRTDRVAARFLRSL